MPQEHATSPSLGANTEARGGTRELGQRAVLGINVDLVLFLGLHIHC